jgi:hypothetical protein
VPGETRALTATLAIVIIAPDFCAIMTGAACFIVNITPRTFGLKVESKSSDCTFCMLIIAAPLPALFTRQSMRPKRATVASINAFTLASSVTSVANEVQSRSATSFQCASFLDATSRADNFRAFGDEYLRYTFSDPARHSGDNRDLAVKLSHVPLRSGFVPAVGRCPGRFAVIGDA